MPVPIPSAPTSHWVTTALVHRAASGQWHSTHVTLGARTSLKTACGSHCRAAPQSFSSLGSIHAGNQGQFPFALGPTELCSQPIPCSHAGKSVFLHLVNLVSLPAPRDPLSLLEAGGSMGYFFLCSMMYFYLKQHFKAPIWTKERERKKRQVNIIKCHSPHKWLGFQCNVVRFLICACPMRSPRN